MRAGRGKAVVLSTMTLALVVLAGAGFAFRQPLLDRVAEEWWLWKLRSGDEKEQDRAVDFLTKNGSARALLPAIRHWRKHVDDPRQVVLADILDSGLLVPFRDGFKNLDQLAHRPGATGRLLEGLEDPDARIRGCCTDWLNDLAASQPLDGAMVERLRQFMDRESQVRVKVVLASAILRSEPEDLGAVQILISSRDYLGDHFLAKNLRNRPTWPPEIVAGLKLALADPELRAQTMELLARLGSRATPLLPDLIRGLEDAEGGVRASAAQAIAGCAGEEARAAVAPLQRRVTMDPDLRVRDQAFRALILLREDPVPAFQEILDGPTSETCDWALGILQKWPSLGIPLASLPDLQEALERVRAEGGDRQKAKAAGIIEEIAAALREQHALDEQREGGKE